MLALFGAQLKGGIAYLGETPSKTELKAMRESIPNLMVAPGVVANRIGAP